MWLWLLLAVHLLAPGQNCEHKGIPLHWVEEHLDFVKESMDLELRRLLVSTGNCAETLNSVGEDLSSGRKVKDRDSIPSLEYSSS